MNSDSNYASYMLRLQWARNNTEPTWIASMQSTKTGELRWFPNLEVLIAFLREEFDVDVNPRGEEAVDGAVGESLERTPYGEKTRPYGKEHLSQAKHQPEPTTSERTG